MKNRINILLTGLLLATITFILPLPQTAIAAETLVASQPVLLVVPPVKIADPEYLETRKALEASGFKVEVASTSTDTATGYGDLKVKPDLAINAAKAARYSAVVVIGGEGAIIHLWDDIGLRGLLKNATERKKLIGAICSAPVTLARAGLLKGRSATSYPDAAIVGALKEGGADYRTDAVVVDGRIVTGNGPDASAAFGQKIAALLLAERN